MNTFGGKSRSHLVPERSPSTLVHKPPMLCREYDRSLFQPTGASPSRQDRHGDLHLHLPFSTSPAMLRACSGTACFLVRRMSRGETCMAQMLSMFVRVPNIQGFLPLLPFMDLHSKHCFYCTVSLAQHVMDRSPQIAQALHTVDRE
jgi:hypothetical protein